MTRRVVTRLDAAGRGSFASDGLPPDSVVWPSGVGVTELLSFDGPTWDLMTPFDRTARVRPTTLPSGGLSSRIVRCPPSEEWHDLPPSLWPDETHTSESLDLVYILEGSITLELAGEEEEEVTLQRGDVVIQQGVARRWRTGTAEPAVLWVTTLWPQFGAGVPDLPRNGGSSGVRRIITGGNGTQVDEAPGGRLASGNAMSEIWQTGGPVVSVSQGGDVPGPFDLEPAGGGVALRYFEMAPGAADEQPNEGWHVTSTVDVEVILSGRIALDLPIDQRVELAAGDSVVQGGTEHRWIPLGEETVKLVVLMVAIP
jgi:quercetin dioxygenase-like cupin family protein